MKKIILLIGFVAAQSSYAMMKPGIDGHARGDVISVTSDEEIAAWCTFTTQIVVTKTSVLCIYNGTHTNTELTGNTSYSNTTNPT